MERSSCKALCVGLHFELRQYRRLTVVAGTRIPRTGRRKRCARASIQTRPRHTTRKLSTTWTGLLRWRSKAKRSSGSKTSKRTLRVKSIIGKHATSAGTREMKRTGSAPRMVVSEKSAMPGAKTDDGGGLFGRGRLLRGRCTGRGMWFHY